MACTPTAGQDEKSRTRFQSTSHQAAASQNGAPAAAGKSAGEQQQAAGSDGGADCLQTARKSALGRKILVPPAGTAAHQKGAVWSDLKRHFQRALRPEKRTHTNGCEVHHEQRRKWLMSYKPTNLRPE